MRLSFLSVAGVLSGLLAVAVGAILVVKAPCFLIESIWNSDYSIGPFIPFPMMPALIVAVGLFTFALALKGHRHFSPLTSMCLGLLIITLTFRFPDGEVSGYQSLDIPWPGSQSSFHRPSVSQQWASQRCRF